MAIDKLNLYHKKQHIRTRPNSADPYLALLVRLYKFLARRTNSAFNKEVLKRLVKSRVNRPVISLSRLAAHMKRAGDKTAVCICTIVDDPRMLEIPKMSVCALRFTAAARARIVKAGGECITLDELAIRKPTGSNAVLLRGSRLARKAVKYFGAPAGSPSSNTRPRNGGRTKFGKREIARGK